MLPPLSTKAITPQMTASNKATIPIRAGIGRLRIRSIPGSRAIQGSLEIKVSMRAPIVVGTVGRHSSGGRRISPTPAEGCTQIVLGIQTVLASPTAGARHSQRAQSGEQEPTGQQPGNIGTGLSQLGAAATVVLAVAVLFALVAVVFAVLAVLFALVAVVVAMVTPVVVIIVLVGLVGEGLGLAENHQQNPVEHIKAQRLLRTASALGVLEDNRLALVEQQAQDCGVTAVVRKSQPERSIQQVGRLTVAVDTQQERVTLSVRLVRPRLGVGVDCLDAEPLAWGGQLVTLADAQVQQLVGRVGLGVPVLLVPLGDTEAFGNTQGQEPVALVGGGDILVVPALVEEAQSRNATTGSSEGVVVILGGHGVVVEQAQAEQPTSGAAQFERVTVVA